MNVEIRGVAYNVEVEGDPAATQAVVLLHGFCGSSADWAELQPALRSMGRAVIAIDLAGHGRTRTPDDPARYTMSETVRDLDSITSLLGASQADWVGYSMGGRVALHMALAYPSRVRSLALESASDGIEDRESRERRRQADNALAERIEARGIEWFADYWSTLPLFETQWELPSATLSALRLRRLANSPAGLAHSLRGMGQGAHEYLGHRLPELRGDVLFLAGERDLKYAEVARRAASAVPGARFAIIPRAGHTVHLEAPEDFADELAAHWKVVRQRVETAST